MCARNSYLRKIICCTTLDSICTIIQKIIFQPLGSFAIGFCNLTQINRIFKVVRICYPKVSINYLGLYNSTTRVTLIAFVALLALSANNDTKVGNSIIGQGDYKLTLIIDFGLGDADTIFTSGASFALFALLTLVALVSLIAKGINSSVSLQA